MAAPMIYFLLGAAIMSLVMLIYGIIDAAAEIQHRQDEDRR